MLVNLDNKVLTFLSSPRSGSTVMSKILFQYFKRTYGFNQLFNEPFFESRITRTLDGVRVSEDQFGPGYVKNFILTDKKQLIEVNDLKASGRINHSALIRNIKECKNKIILHCQINNLKLISYNFIVKNPVIFIERRDKWEQVLSLGLAIHTRLFHVKESKLTPEVKLGTVEMPLDSVRYILDSICLLKKTQRDFPQFPTIFYEDFSFSDATNFIETTLRLPKSKIPSKLICRNIFEKFEYGEKERYFKNLKEIRKLFDDYKKGMS